MESENSNVCWVIDRKVTSLRIVGYHEELWTLNIQLSLFLYVFGWFLSVASYVCLIFTIQWSSAIELGWVMERFLSYYGNCS
jgi:hypothetical protein